MTQAAEQPKAVVLLSGGLDSATVLAMARSEGFQCYTLSLDYGQRHRLELDAARRVAQSLDAVNHRLVKLDLGQFGGSALTDSSIPVPDRPSAGIPSTYVPARNTVFLAIALGWAETLNAKHIFIGANAVDYSGYPDCRPEYIESFERLANLATRVGVEQGGLRIRAPLIRMTKAQIIQAGMRLGVDYALTRSCYQPNAQDTPCRVCDACRLRAKGFAEAGLPDPTLAPTSALT